MQLKGLCMKIEKGQTEQNRSKRLAKLLGFIAISIIIHLTLVIILFRHGFHKQAMSWINSLNKNLTPEEQKQRAEQIQQKREAVMAKLQELKQDKKDNRPAQLRAPKSDFGWVLFDEPPKKADPNAPIEIPTTMEGPVGQAVITQATENEQEEPIQPGNQPESQEKKQAENQASELAEIEPVIEQARETAPEPAPAQPKELPKPTPAIADNKPVIKELPGDGPLAKVKTSEPAAPPKLLEKDISQRIADIKAMEEKLTAYAAGKTPASSSPAQEQRGSVHVRGANSIEQKPKRNIIALTKGFVEKRYGEEGTDLVDRDGDPDKVPSFEELKYLSYEAKLNWSLQASWKQNFCYQRMRQPLEGDATIEFTIDEYGNVTNCTLLQSTGHSELDTMVLRNVKVASPLPPIPKHFGTKTYTTGRIIRVRSNNFDV